MQKLIIFLLIPYSITILIVEYLFGQDYVRFYLTDIEGEVLFYGFNTTLNTGILWIIAFIFYLTWTIALRLNNVQPQRLRYFFSQIMIFGYLGFDERFKIHENMGKLLPFDDSLILFFIGIVELAILYFWADILKYSRESIDYILIAGGCFGAMVLIDGLLPSQLLFRLSLEDLFKTWATFFLLLFALKEFYNTLDRLIA